METQAVQKWYAKPQVIAIGAAAAYLLLSKKTRKPVAITAGAVLLLEGVSAYKQGDGFNKAIGVVFIPAGAGLIWYGLRKKK